MPLCDAIYHDLHYEDHTGNINGCDRYDDGSYKNLNNAKIIYCKENSKRGYQLRSFENRS